MFRNVLLVSVVLLGFCQDSFGFTLEKSYESALRSNQSDNINAALVDQSLERKNQAEGGYLPSLSIRGGYLKQDNIDDQSTAGLNLSANLFNGGRDKLIIDSTNLGIQIARNQRQIDRVNLYIDVVDAYYNYLINFNDIKNLELLRNQSRERTDEIRKRVQIGKSRRGELMQAEAQLASAEAQLVNGQGLVKESRERFIILTGMSEGLDKLAMGEVKIEKSLEEFIKLAEAREDIQNREMQIEQFSTEIDINKRHWYPNLELTSNYYVHKNGVSVAQKNSDWDVGLNLKIPLYEGGIAQAKTRETVEKRKVAEYQLIDYRRNVRLQVTTRYENYRRFSDQISAFDRAYTRAKSSYDETLKDYRLGLVTNLDVLSSLNLYLDAKRNLERIKIQAIQNYRILEATSGIIPVS